MQRFLTITRAAVAALSLSSALLLTGCLWESDEEAAQPSELPAEVKKAFGADPASSDTDGDGLTDDFEIKYGFPFLKPDVRDTDGNGVSDADEDNDHDGLVNSEEQKFGTSPLSSDTDGDGVSDYDEIKVSHTDPLTADTDGDGVSDGRELANGTNPLVADASVVIKSVQQHLVVDPASGAAATVKVEIEGPGDLAGQARVVRRTSRVLPFETGNGFDISLPAALVSTMQSAKITIPYDPAAAGAIGPTDFVIVTIDPATGFFEALPTVVDVTAKTLTATTTHFSEFNGVTKSQFDAWLANLPKSCTPTDDPNAQPADVVLVIDSSGSMQTNDPSNLRLTAARNFASQMKPVDRISVVDFDSAVQATLPLTSQVATVIAAINRIDSSGGTDIGAGVSAAINVLKGSSEATRRQAIFLLTDGDGSYDAALTRAAAAAGIKIFAIGLSNSVNATLLSSIASGTGAVYRQLADASGLVQVFAEFAGVFGDNGTDTDGDGLTDCQEIYGVFVTKLRRFVTSDPGTPHSDTDGVEDGEEVGTVRRVTVPFSTVKLVVGDGESDPMMADTDGDGLTDDREYAEETKPYAKDSDEDGIEDPVELANGTSPTNPDTDLDTLIDSADANPLVYDQQVSKLSYVSQFVIGYVCPGDFEFCVDALPKVAGKLANAFTPVVGNVYDVVSLVVNVFRGDKVSAGMDAIGIAGTLGYLAGPVGVVTDLAANVLKGIGIIGRVVVRGGAEALHAARMLIKVFPESLQADVGVLVSKQVFKTSHERLVALGVSEASLGKIAAKQNVHPDEIVASVERARQTTTGTGFLADWREAETLVRQGRPRWGKSVPPPGKPPRRYPDDFEPATGAAREAKSGCEDSSRVIEQVAKDQELKAVGRYASVEWHFFASAVSSCIGPGARVRAALVAAGIPYVVHLP